MGFLSELFFQHGLVDMPVPISPRSGLWSTPRAVALNSIKGDGLEGGETFPPMVPTHGGALGNHAGPLFCRCPQSARRGEM